MIGERESQDSLAAKRLEQEQLKQKKIAELAPSIWSEVESVLKEAVAAFNQISSIPINIDAYSQPYTLELNAASYQYGWIVKFDPSTGTISFGNPLTEFIHSSLLVKLDLDGESHYTFYDSRNPREIVSPADIDEVVLRGFVKLILKESSKLERASDSLPEI
jgi:hypothetical protein